jgi:hypothetical protein
MSGRYDKIKEMSLSQLKKEYHSCDEDDNVKKQILKKLIKNKIHEDAKQEAFNKSMQNEIDDRVNALIKIKEIKDKQHKANKMEELERVLEKRGKMEKYWEANKKGIDNKFKTELEQDFTNNKLMERLNCELDFRINEEKTKETIKPYSELTDGNYNEFKRQSIPKNFSSRRMLH